MDKLKALVMTAVELAIIRNDLSPDDGEPGLMDAESCRAIALDAWDALNGIGTCDGGPAPALVAVVHERDELLAALKEMVADLLSHARLGLNEAEVAMLKRAEAAIAKAEGGST